jgi:23S rRNA (adenine2503-C2)-methyltransferase
MRSLLLPLGVLLAPTASAMQLTTTGTTKPVNLLATTPEDLRSTFEWPHRQQADKVRAVWGSLRKGIDVLDADEAAQTKYLSRNLHKQLVDACSPVCPATQQSALLSSDGTCKLLVELHDGLEVECVLIPISGKHTSLCVSSQIGCSRACRFCSTGTMGLLRNLSTEEILAQVFMALRHARECDMPPLVNLVFMGMGEPLNNFEAVKAAVEQLVHPDAFAFSRRNVVVSTVGPSPSLIAKAGTLPCRLAWSVHAADDSLRKLLVPTTRDRMETLRDAFIAALAFKPGGDKAKVLLIELALIGGVNDGLEHAEQLAHLLHPFRRSEMLVNLIPYNENGLGLPGGELFRASERANVYAFQRKLWDKGILCTVRATRGDDERSACGQLATEAKARRGEAVELHGRPSARSLCEPVGQQGEAPLAASKR